eukprot:TRINITY_DN32205_c0_g1_i1.p1 TRINITY_DN32205_c0_g1~~TRINITY_DN32205_c0_g1_i1.p1  ORF type:complete len:1184 (+),score=192.30 TRINITY_DN32205_c0_g1_i1:532-3552(+)
MVKCAAADSSVKRKLGDLSVTCDGAKATESSSPAPPPPAAGPTSRKWRIVAAWEQELWVAVSELRLFADASCQSLLPQPLPPASAMEALGGSSLGHLAAVPAFYINRSSAFAHRCTGSPSCVVKSGEAYLEVEYAEAQAVNCVEIVWLVPKSDNATAVLPLWVLRRKDASGQWVDSSHWRGATPPDGCHGIDCGEHGTCQVNEGGLGNCICSHNFNGFRCENYVGQDGVSPKLFNFVPESTMLEDYVAYRVTRAELCGQKCLDADSCLSWAYNPWNQKCRIGKWTRKCSSPVKSEGWGFFELKRGQSKAPYHLEETSDVCPAPGPASDALQSSHLLLARVASARLGAVNESLQARAKRLESMIEPLLGFPGKILSTGAAASDEQPSDLVPAGRAVGLFSKSKRKYFGLAPNGKWSVTQEVKPNRKRHLMEVLDAGNGNVALRSAVEPWSFLRASRYNDTVVVCQARPTPEADDMVGFLFRAKRARDEAGETGVVLLSADYGVPLKAAPDGECLMGSRWSTAAGVNLSTSELFEIHDTEDAAADAPTVSSEPSKQGIVVDQDGVRLGSEAGTLVTEDSVVTAVISDSESGTRRAWMEVPITWEGVQAPDTAGGLLQFGVWQKPSWLSSSVDTQLPDNSLSDPGFEVTNGSSDQSWDKWNSDGKATNTTNKSEAVAVLIAQPDIGPFHPLPTWLGALLLALTSLIFVGLFLYLMRPMCRKDKVTEDGSSRRKRWGSAAIANAPAWAPRMQGQSIDVPALSGLQPDPKLAIAEDDERANKIRSLQIAARTQDSTSQPRLSSDAWVKDGDSQAVTRASPTAGAGKQPSRHGSKTPAAPGQPASPSRKRQNSHSSNVSTQVVGDDADDVLDWTTDSSQMRRAMSSSLGFSGPRTYTAFTESQELFGAQVTRAKSEGFASGSGSPSSKDAAKVRETEARQERVRCAVRAIREAMKVDRSQGVSREARLERLKRWREEWDPSQSKDKIASSVTTFLNEAEEWYLKAASGSKDG